MTSPTPNQPALWEQAKRHYVDMPHSAYKSGLIVQRYKELGGTFRGKKTQGGLTRWFKEDWRTQDGSKTYKRKGDIFRPTKRVNSKTPTTLGELSDKQIRQAQRSKRQGKRANFGE